MLSAIEHGLALQGHAHSLYGFISNQLHIYHHHESVHNMKRVGLPCVTVNKC